MSLSLKMDPVFLWNTIWMNKLPLNYGGEKLSYYYIVHESLLFASIIILIR